jgi:sortase A
VGRTLVTAGILTLLFVVYQLWGTGIYADRQQTRLRTQFETALQQSGSRSGNSPVAATTTTTGPRSTPTTTSTTAPAPPPPPQGDAVAQIRITRIGLDSIVVNGVNVDNLREGPGHYPGTPLPGQVGNAAIAGHRTTYGAPFGGLDDLTIGDTIVVRTLQGTFTYLVYDKLVVNPSDVSVLNDDPDRPAILTLTTCTPKYSAAQRLVVKAALHENQQPLPAPLFTNAPKVGAAGLSGESASKLPTALAGAIAALIGALWLLVFHRYPRWTTWIVGAVPFAVALFVFFVFLERILPSNY